MEVSLSRLKQAGAKHASAQRLAKEYEKQTAFIIRQNFIKKTLHN